MSCAPWEALITSGLPTNRKVARPVNTSAFIWSNLPIRRHYFRFPRDSAGMRTVILGREVENDIDRALVLLSEDSASAPPVRSELSKRSRPSPSSQPVL